MKYYLNLLASKHIRIYLCQKPLCLLLFGFLLLFRLNHSFHFCFIRFFLLCFPFSVNFLLISYLFPRFYCTFRQFFSYFWLQKTFLCCSYAYRDGLNYRQDYSKHKSQNCSLWFWDPNAYLLHSE